MTQKTSLKDRCFTDILFFEASQLMVLIAAKIVDAVLLKRFGIQFQLCTSGAASVAAELATIAFLLLRLNREDRVLLRQRRRKMQPWDLAALVSLLCTIQFGYVLLTGVVEALLQRFSWSTMPQQEADLSIGLILNACTLAPVTEELVFRGAALRLHRHGRVIAVAVTALLFGLAHGTVYQAVYAGLCGVVLGYAAVTYSLGWAVLLHIFSNVVLGYGLPRLLEGLPGAWDVGVYITICLAAAFVSFRWLAPKRDRILAAVETCVIREHWEGVIQNPVFRVLTVWNGVVIASNFMAV